MSIPFRIREVAPADLEQVLHLGRMLNSINLPTDDEGLASFIQQSRRSFRGQFQDPREGVYLFVLEDCATHQITGTAMLIAKHGTPECPHYYLEMATDERYSKTLKKMFRHTHLTLRHSMDGPTELGGLIVDPAFRNAPAKIGKQLSFIRFLYLAMYPERFEDRVLAEMLPPLTADKESLFWECYGKRVTGLSFREADTLSITDKEFIEALFPSIPLYMCMLPLPVQEQIGQVGPDTQGAVHLLKKVGLRFLNHVDPFDGGPFYGARVEDLVPIQQFRRYCIEVSRADLDTQQMTDLLIGWEGEDGFRAAQIAAQPDTAVLRCSAPDAAALNLHAGMDVGAIPFL
jgi:arginine N-succinyltransferase